MIINLENMIKVCNIYMYTNKACETAANTMTDKSLLKHDYI